MSDVRRQMSDVRNQISGFSVIITNNTLNDCYSFIQTPPPGQVFHPDIERSEIIGKGSLRELSKKVLGKYLIPEF
jgi:hypothetical protein